MYTVCYVIRLQSNYIKVQSIRCNRCKKKAWTLINQVSTLDKTSLFRTASPIYLTKKTKRDNEVCLLFVTTSMKENNEFHLCSSSIILSNVSCPMEHCYKSTKKTKVCGNLLGILDFQGKRYTIHLSFYY